MAVSRTTSVEEIKKNSNLNLSNFNNYRLRLLRKEMIESKRYGELSFTLPRFQEFVIVAMQFEL